MELRFSPGEPSDKLPESLEVAVPEIISVCKACRVDSDQTLVLVASVRVCGLRDGAAGLCQALDVPPVHADVP